MEVLSIQGAGAPPLDEKATIRHRVETDPFFKNVVDKEGLIGELWALSIQPDFKGKIHHLCSELTENPEMQWATLLQDPGALNLILLGYIQGVIPDFQVATAHDMAATLERYSSVPFDVSCEEIPIFIRGDVNPIARRLLKQTLQKVSHFSEVFFQLLTYAQIDELIEEFRKLPTSEQRFMIGTVYHGGRKEIGRARRGVDQYGRKLSAYENLIYRHKLYVIDQPEIMDAVHAAGFNLFTHVDHNGKSMRMVASCGMQDKLIEFIEGDNIRLFMLGANDSAWLNGQRVNSLRSRWAPSPDTADGYPAPYESFSKHDYYHCVRVAFIKRLHRETLFALVDKIKESPQYANHPKLVETFCKRVIDMETSAYDKGGIRNNEENLGLLSHNLDERLDISFWIAIHGFLTSANQADLIEAALENERAPPEERTQKGDAIVLAHPSYRMDPILEGAIQYALVQLFVIDTQLIDAAKITLKTLVRVSESFKARTPDIIWPLTRLATFAQDRLKV